MLLFSNPQSFQRCHTVALREPTEARSFFGSSRSRKKRSPADGRSAESQMVGHILGGEPTAVRTREYKPTRRKLPSKPTIRGRHPLTTAAPLASGSRQPISGGTLDGMARGGSEMTLSSKDIYGYRHGRVPMRCETARIRPEITDSPVVFTPTLSPLATPTMDTLPIGSTLKSQSTGISEVTPQRYTALRRFATDRSGVFTTSTFLRDSVRHSFPRLPTAMLSPAKMSSEGSAHSTKSAEAMVDSILQMQLQKRALTERIDQTLDKMSRVSTYSAATKKPSAMCALTETGELFDSDLDSTEAMEIEDEWLHSDAEFNENPFDTPRSSLLIPPQNSISMEWSSDIIGCVPIHKMKSPVCIPESQKLDTSSGTETESRTPVSVISSADDEQSAEQRREEEVFAKSAKSAQSTSVKTVAIENVPVPDTVIEMTTIHMFGAPMDDESANEARRSQKLSARLGVTTKEFQKLQKEQNCESDDESNDSDESDYYTTDSEDEYEVDNTWGIVRTPLSDSNTPMRTRLRHVWLYGKSPIGRAHDLFMFCVNLFACVWFVAGVEGVDIPVVNAFLASVFLTDYSVRLYASKHPLAYVSSMHGVADLLSCSGVFQSEHYLLHSLGFLRATRLTSAFRLLSFWRATRTNRTPKGERTSLKFSLVGYILSTMFVGAGLFVTVEGPNSPTPTVYSFFESFYLISCTVSTVGYGDIVPQTNLGRLILLGVISSALVVIPYRLSVLTSIHFEWCKHDGEDAESVTEEAPEIVAQRFLQSAIGADAIGAIAIDEDTDNNEFDDDIYLCHSCGSSWTREHIYLDAFDNDEDFNEFEQKPHCLNVNCLSTDCNSYPQSFFLREMQTLLHNTFSAAESRRLVPRVQTPFVKAATGHLTPLSSFGSSPIPSLGASPLPSLIGASPQPSFSVKHATDEITEILAKEPIIRRQPPLSRKLKFGQELACDMLGSFGSEKRASEHLSKELPKLTPESGHRHSELSAIKEDYGEVSPQTANYCLPFDTGTVVVMPSPSAASIGRRDDKLEAMHSLSRESFSACEVVPFEATQLKAHLSSSLKRTHTRHLSWSDNSDDSESDGKLETPSPRELPATKRPSRVRFVVTEMEAESDVFSLDGESFDSSDSSSPPVPDPYSPQSPGAKRKKTKKKHPTATKHPTSIRLPSLKIDMHAKSADESGETQRSRRKSKRKVQFSHGEVVSGTFDLSQFKDAAIEEQKRLRMEKRKRHLRSKSRPAIGTKKRRRKSVDSSKKKKRRHRRGKSLK